MNVPATTADAIRWLIVRIQTEVSTAAPVLLDIQEQEIHLALVIALLLTSLLNTFLDINECSRYNGGCDRLTTCINLVGSYKCSACPTGYSGTGNAICIDINECALNTSLCTSTPGMYCVNTPGTYTCSVCPQGYQPEGSSCIGMKKLKTSKRKTRKAQ